MSGATAIEKRVIHVFNILFFEVYLGSSFFSVSVHLASLKGDSMAQNQT